MNSKLIITLLCTIFLLTGRINAQTIPLPEHPRPDFERPEWINLNGYWNFTFNKTLADEAINRNNINGLDRKILVPFSWGSPLSEVKNDGHQGWYGRSVTIPEAWKGKRIYLVIGASEWDTNVWFDGKPLGNHQGGYTPFEFELTEHVQFNRPQNIMVLADDTPTDQRLGGKQGYGDARGIWQTVYVEARGENFIDYVHFTPDIDKSTVKVELALNQLPDNKTRFEVKFKNGEQTAYIYTPKGKALKSLTHTFEIKLTNQRLWDLDNPYLYELEVALTHNNTPTDVVNTYFGQRKISVENLPGTDYPYVALNNKPIYLQTCLDQSYHPEGYYTFPTDKFMRDEILLSKKLGLNGNRIHIKVEIPRKLYWADKLGLLIMADVPNWWGDVNDLGKKDWEHCMRNQVKRDFNHPSIFSWVNFNETWGLFTRKDGKQVYETETQEWVRYTYHEVKKLDPSRLVEDNSPVNLDHVETDINTWHAYAPGYAWKNILDNNVKNTFPGSTWNYIGGNKQTNIPMFNSECGNVWGYEGSTGDVDYTWDYHMMINEFRSHPKCAGWLYTEHHDVINEWNGYVRYDRSPKIDGLNELVPGMTIADFHTLYYIAPQGDICREVKAGATVDIPLFASFMTDANPGKLTLETALLGWNTLGQQSFTALKSYDIPFQPFINNMIDPLQITTPREAGLYICQMILKSESGNVLGRNFMALNVTDGTRPDTPKQQLVSFAPASFSAANWSLKQWNVLDGLKVNGAGSGYFEYTIPWPEGCKVSDLQEVSLVFEASAKEFFGKDAQGLEIINTDFDFMRGRGTNDPCMNKNAYAMTDLTVHPSMLKITANGAYCSDAYLPDDPADHRGILSWFSQPRNSTLHEAGSHGYLVQTAIPLESLREGQPITIRIEVPSGVNGGVAIYGSKFGRYPLDPTLIFIKKEKQVYRNPIIDYSLPDPTIVKADDGYFYLYATEDIRNMPIHRSKDLVNWELIGTAFTDETRPNFQELLWAPDINKIGKNYVLYYANSWWGEELTNGLGAAYSTKPEGPFTDVGKLFLSQEIDVKNSIDAFYMEDKGRKYLFWGSWHGLWGVELTDDGLSLKPGTTKIPIAGNGYEAGLLHKRGDYFYLFASIGTCCQGLQSTYTAVVGRSKNLFGPYENKKGELMLNNCHEIVIQGNETFVGPGHNSQLVTDDAGNDWIFYHAVKVSNPEGRVLMMDKVEWIDGWPYVKGASPSIEAEVPVFKK